MQAARSSATNLTVGDTTGWQNGDTLGFTPTGSSNTQYETKLISTVGSSTTVTLTTGLTNAHSGSSTLPTGVRGYVLNLTRNIVIRSVSTTNLGQFYVPVAGGTVNLNYVEFTINTLGNGFFNGSCLHLRMTTNSVTLNHCTGNPNAAGAGNNKKLINIPDAACNN